MSAAVSDQHRPWRRHLARWLWPSLVVVVALVFALRIYFQRNPSTLDGDMERGELIALASTPGGQAALERMLRSLASMEAPLDDRLVELARRHSPDTLHRSHEPLQADEDLLNTIRVLEKLPAELKAPHLPVLVRMLDHPLHAAIAMEELENLGTHTSNAVPFLLTRLDQTNAGPTVRLDIATIDLAAKLAPDDPRIFTALERWVTNGAAPSFDRNTAVRRLAELYPENPRTRQILTATAQDPDPFVAGAAQSQLSRFGLSRGVE